MTELLPHPKRLSVEAAKSLQESSSYNTEADKMQEASVFDPAVHKENEALVRTKAERFAILAHLAEEVSKEVVVGEGKETRFYHPIQSSTSTRPATDIPPFWALEQDLLDDETINLIAIEVLREKQYAPIVRRFKEIVMQIATHPATENELFYGKDDTVENRLGGLSYDIIVNTILMMEIILKHIRDEFPEIVGKADTVREIMLDNIDFLEDLANKNLAHSKKLVHIHVTDYDSTEKELDTSFEYSGYYSKTVLQKQNGKYVLKLLSKNPKPKTGLYGATMGCPANYHLTEGDTVVRKYATAIINEAFDRKLFSKPIRLRE